MFADVMLPRGLVAPSVFAILGNKKGPATNGRALSLGSIRSGRNEWVSLSTPDDLRLVIFCHSFVFSGRAVARTSDQRQAGAFAQNESAPMPQPCHVLHQIGSGNRRQDDQKARRPYPSLMILNGLDVQYRRGHLFSDVGLASSPASAPPLLCRGWVQRTCKKFDCRQHSPMTKW